MSNMRLYTHVFVLTQFFSLIESQIMQNMKNMEYTQNAAESKRLTIKFQ